MPGMIQIRNVPDKLHRQLKARAALEGASMSQYILREIKKSLERPSMEEILARITSQPEQKLSRTAADMVREDRSSH